MPSVDALGSMLSLGVRFGIIFLYFHENLYVTTVARVMKAIQKVVQH